MDEQKLTDIKSFNLTELRDYVADRKEKAFRADQLYDWMHKKRVASFDEMTNLSKDFREGLKRDCRLTNLREKKRQISADGTEKFLFSLSDGNCVESVLMRYRHGFSACISTQVGCCMGCSFCASTVGGLVRNLTVSEMLEQVYQLSDRSEERISNVILMGIGEPLDNYGNVIKFIRMLSDENGINISQRNITISTCGLTEQIDRLSSENLSVTLTVSLHAPNDALRRQIMPIANRYAVDDIIRACTAYEKKTGRRITFAYSMIAGKNDSALCAQKLAQLLSGINCHVNLILLNPVHGRSGSRSSREKVDAFVRILKENHINVTVRRELGSDIDAACGQLRNREKQTEPAEKQRLRQTETEPSADLFSF